MEGLLEKDGNYRARYEKRETPYQIWQRGEGIPINKGSFAPNLHTVEVAPWPRIGQKGAFVNLADQQQDDGWVIEIAPGGHTEALHHACEATVHALSGRGATQIWQDEKHKQTVEWQRGALFAPPLNCYYQHFNLDGQQSARLFCVTNAPMILNVYRNSDFVFNNPYVFNDRYALEDDYFSDPGRPVDRNVWKTNFVPDVRTFSLQPSQRGMSANGMQFILSNNQAMAHITAFPPGVYKLGHRHGVGAHVLILDGEGYSLLWFEGQERERVNWQDGTVLSPKEGQYHQHFNAAPKPARYVAFRLGDLDNHRPPPGQGWNTHAEIMGIQYVDEDPAVYNLYVEECAKRGTTVILPRPDYAKA